LYHSSMPARADMLREVVLLRTGESRRTSGKIHGELRIIQSPVPLVSVQRPLPVHRARKCGSTRTPATVGELGVELAETATTSPVARRGGRLVNWGSTTCGRCPRCSYILSRHSVYMHMREYRSDACMRNIVLVYSRQRYA
jgi:hypothetical protein